MLRANVFVIKTKIRFEVRDLYYMRVATLANDVNR